MKRLKSSYPLMGLALLSLMITAAFSNIAQAGTVNLSVGNASGQTGDLVSVSVTGDFSASSPVAAFQLNLNYGAGAPLTVASVSPGADVKDLFGNALFAVTYNPNTPGVIIINGFYTGLTTPPLTGAGPKEILKIFFNVTTPSGSAPYTFHLSNIALYDNSAPAVLQTSTVTDGTFTYNSNNHAPVWTAIGAQAVTEGSGLTFNVTATDQDAGDTLTYSATGLPTGATFNTSTHVFDWPASATIGKAVGSPYSVTFSVTDGKSTPVTQVASIVVNAAQTFTITTSTSGGTGTGTLAFTCGGSACTSPVPAGTSVTFTATPNSGSTFGAWGGACAAVGTTSSPYTCTVTVNANTSASATFTLLASAISITTQPAASTTIYLGKPVTLIVVASGGTGTLKYQWQTDASGSYQDIAGATNATYTTTPTSATDAVHFKCNVTDQATGAATSNVATVTVIKAGDVNHDGVVNLTDYFLIRAHVLGITPITNPTSIAFKAADVMGNGAVVGINLGDGLSIIQKILNSTYLFFVEQ